MVDKFDIFQNSNERLKNQKSAIKNQKIFVNDENFNKPKFKFDENNYLSQNIIKIYKQIGSAQPKNYISIESTPEEKTGPEFLINSFISKGFKQFWNITPTQLSALIPKLRIFKVFKDQNGKKKDIEFIFDNKFPEGDLSAILNDNFARGGSAGLKSFTWEDLSTQPAETRFAFRANLETFFQSARIMFDKRKVYADGKSYEISYSDLFSYPPVEKLKNLDYNPKFYEIHVIVGWNVPHFKEQLFSQDLLKEIRNTQAHFILNLVRRVINYDQKGYIHATANYVGRAEISLKKPSSDVLYVNSKYLEKQSEPYINKVEEILDNIDKLKQEKRDKSNLAFKQYYYQKQIGSSGGQQNYLEEINSIESGYNIEIQELENQINKIVKQSKKIDKTISHSRIMKNLIANNLIFPFIIDRHILEIELDKTLTDEEKQEKLKTYQEEEKKSIPSTPTVLTVTEPEKLLKATTDYINSDEENRDKEYQKFLNLVSSTNLPANSEEVIINVIKFGDLLDVVLDVLYNNTSYIKDEEIENLNIVLSSMYIKQKINGRIKTFQIPLKDIPISVNQFMNWWFEKVVRTNKEKYYLLDFIKDFLNEFLSNVLSPKKENEKLSNGPFRPALTSIVLPKSKTQFLQKGKIIKLSNLQNKLLNEYESDLDSNNLQEFLLIYFTNFQSPLQDDTRNNDLKRGVYHLTVGSPVGLLKEVRFDQMQLQYYVESAILNANEATQGDVFQMEPFNAKISMFGNTLFKNGSKVYIEPESLGVGFSNTGLEEMRIGGYYDVISVSNKISGKEFTTELKCISQAINTDKNINFETSDSLTSESEPKIDDVRVSDVFGAGALKHL